MCILKFLCIQNIYIIYYRLKTFRFKHTNNIQSLSQCNMWWDYWEYVQIFSFPFLLFFLFFLFFFFFLQVIFHIPFCYSNSTSFLKRIINWVSDIALQNNQWDESLSQPSPVLIFFFFLSSLITSKKNWNLFFVSLLINWIF